MHMKAALKGATGYYRKIGGGDEKGLAFVHCSLLYGFCFSARNIVRIFCYKVTICHKQPHFFSHSSYGSGVGALHWVSAQDLIRRPSRCWPGCILIRGSTGERLTSELLLGVGRILFLEAVELLTACIFKDNSRESPQHGGGGALSLFYRHLSFISLSQAHPR